MKKIFTLIVGLTTLFSVGCDPMDDIYDDLNIQDNEIQGNIDYTLEEKDYTDILDLNYSNFNSVDDAKSLIPQVLSEKYPALGKGSLASVTYDIYSSRPKEDSLIVYSATNDDYAKYGDDKYPNWDGMSQIYDFLKGEYPDAENRTLVSLTYDYFDGGTKELNNGFFYVNGEWMFIQGFTQEEYAEMGESYANFSNEDEAYQKIPIYLKDKFKYETVEAGDIQPIMYKLYKSGKTVSYIAYFIYDGEMWSIYDNVLSQTLQFGHDGETWIPDNTIQYSFTSEDYTLAANELSSKYPDATDNLSNYGNFNKSRWDDDMLLEAINVVLDNLSPNAEVGQKYVVKYTVYAGGTSDETRSVIKSEDGSWVDL
ncbi:hypothetical protein [Zunongwangia pacifica]|uniref:DUF5017 domain-containing protein n=1 Tax=Zunongwangia pacifica TaxID=2911062 RepID=A0A9X2CP85_9FLAO|nr:hypothetical protein [Zunongwangia pacifica]MCL6219659.1 hypothetical protein [Zunongwangia pacifica]